MTKSLWLEPGPLEMIVFFKLIIQGENKPCGSFLDRVRAAAKEEGIKLHSLENVFMMPSTDIYHEDSKNGADDIPIRSGLENSKLPERQGNASHGRPLQEVSLRAVNEDL